MKRHKQNKIKEIIFEHIKNNAKGYIVLLFIFVIGIIIGIFVINHTSGSQITDIKQYISDYVTNYRQIDEIEHGSVFIDSLMSNLITFIAIWIIGITATLTPILYGVVLFRGFCLGYTISALIGTLGTKNGTIIVFSLLLLQNLILIPALLSETLSGLLVHTRINDNQNLRIIDRAKKHKDLLKREAIRHSIVSLFIIFPVIISCLIEAYVSTNIFKVVLQYI